MTANAFHSRQRQGQLALSRQEGKGEKTSKKQVDLQRKRWGKEYMKNSESIQAERKKAGGRGKTNRPLPMEKVEKRANDRECPYGPSAPK